MRSSRRWTGRWSSRASACPGRTWSSPTPSCARRRPTVRECIACTSPPWCSLPDPTLTGVLPLPAERSTRSGNSTRSRRCRSGRTVAGTPGRATRAADRAASSPPGPCAAGCSGPGRRRGSTQGHRYGDKAQPVEVAGEVDGEGLPEHRVVERVLHRDVEGPLQALDGHGIGRRPRVPTVDRGTGQPEGDVPADEQRHLEVPRGTLALGRGRGHASRG